MTEKEKMLNGELYDADHDETLIKERILAKELCKKFNEIDLSNIEERKNIIKKLFGNTKEVFWIEPSFWCDYGYNISIGEKFYVNHNCVILDAGKVEFGENVMIGPNCGFYTSGHPLDFNIRNTGLEYAKSIKIGNNVWVGGNVVVLPGVTIEDNVVIGAGSVVNKDIPSNVVAARKPM